MPHGGGRVSIKLRRHRHHYTSGPIRDTKAISLRTELRAKKLLRVAIFQFHIAANEIDPDFADAANDLGLEILFRYLAIVQEPVLNLPRPVRDQTLPSSLAHGAKMYATLMSERVHSGIPTGSDPIVVLAGRHMGQGTASMDSH